MTDGRLSNEELEAIWALLDGIQPGDWTIMWKRGPVAGGWTVEFPVAVHAYDVDADDDGNAKDYGADVCEITDTERDTANAMLISKAPGALRSLRAHIATLQRSADEMRAAALPLVKRLDDLEVEAEGDLPRLLQTAHVYIADLRGLRAALKALPQQERASNELAKQDGV